MENFGKVTSKRGFIPCVNSSGKNLEIFDYTIRQWNRTKSRFNELLIDVIPYFFFFVSPLYSSYKFIALFITLLQVRFEYKLVNNSRKSESLKNKDP